MTKPEFIICTDRGQGLDHLYSTQPSEAAAVAKIRADLATDGFRTWRFWILYPDGHFSAHFDAAHPPR
jgi:hypothetical protein